MLKPILLLGLLMSLLMSVTAQDKYEREYRLQPAEVPPSALAFVERCKFERKVKWYREVSLSGSSVEAKVKEGKHKYSIEFDTLGVIQDVEIEVRWEEIPANTQSAICHQLERRYPKYRVVRMQLQWSASREVLLERISTPTLPEGSEDAKYELIVEAITAEEKAWYELLISSRGNVERVSRILFRNTDNLDYLP